MHALLKTGAALATLAGGGVVLWWKSEPLRLQKGCPGNGAIHRSWSAAAPLPPESAPFPPDSLQESHDWCET